MKKSKRREILEFIDEDDEDVKKEDMELDYDVDEDEGPDSVTIRVHTDVDPLLLTHWPVCQPPEDEADEDGGAMKFTITGSERPAETSRRTVNAQLVGRRQRPGNKTEEEDEGIFYESDTSANSSSKYFIGIRHGKELHIYPSTVFTMYPKVLKPKQTAEEDEETKEREMSLREKLDDIKEKFGSKKTQRLIDQRRKNLATFDENHLTQSLIGKVREDSKEGSKEDSDDEAGDESKPATPKELESPAVAPDSILPDRDDKATSIDMVYKLEDIIGQEIVDHLSSEEVNYTLMQELKTSFVKALFKPKKKSKAVFFQEDARKTIAIYLDCILSLVTQDQRRLTSDGLKDLSDTILKEELLTRYTNWIQTRQNRRRVMSDQQKDKLLIHATILSLMLSNYEPITVEDLQAATKQPPRKLEQVIRVCGFHVERVASLVSQGSSKDLPRKFIIFKLPLAQIEPPKPKRGRRR